MTRETEAIASTWRRLALLVALLALAVQSFVTQTHIHFDRAPPAVATILHSGAPVLTRHTPQPESPADCPICRDLAATGHYLSPVPITVPAPPAAPALLALIAWAAWPRRRPTLGWHSRGPPLPLHA